jgi:hypothetical protein
MYAENIGLDKDLWKSWMKKYSPDWTIIPADIKIKIKQEEEKYRSSCISRNVPSKHKYCYILGRSKKETKELKKLFAENNPTKINLPYPKKRGE